MNSSAALKAFVGEHGGAVCTSSNARAVLEWALGTERASAVEVPSAAASEQFGKGSKVLFFPDQHLGRNTGFDMGYQARDMRVWNPRFELGGLEERDVKEATLLLWKGHCSVHQRFRPEHVAAFRMEHPRGEVIVHPECAHDVVELADRVGSTERILDWVEQAPAGSVLGIGTEIHMVQRMANEHPDLTITSLDPLVCPCSTMFRIDGPHLAWVLESLVRGEVVNQITVDPHISEWARVALQRMLDIT
jgi:quinolinate synthase